MRRLLIAIAAMSLPAGALAMPTAEAIDREVRRVLAGTPVQGLAVGVVEDGRVRHVQAYGRRNAQGAPLGTDTVMYGASLTKAVFAFTVLQLASEGRIDLDASIAGMLPRPLPDYPTDRRYGPWHDLQSDERWRLLTPRILLSHQGGFANFAFLEPDGKLRMHFAPGARYAYSGEGYILMQFVLEQGQGINVGLEIQRRVFDRFGMKRTSMTWRPDFETNQADGWTAEGDVQPHARRSRVRAAGSMDTTIEDFTNFAAAFARGEGLPPAWHAEMTRAQGPITGATQFPTLAPELPPAKRRADLAAGLGVVVFNGPQGPAFFKGGHNDNTGNTWVCVGKRRSCVVLLANDVRAEALFPGLVRFVLGETGAPWDWEYGPPTR
jgi:CubicO group peptidase (beta-lactamase class C family)